MIDHRDAAVRRWASALAVVLVAGLAVPAAAAWEPPPTSPQERIEAAEVPPPGKDCPPDPAEPGRIDEQGKAAALRLASGSAAETVSIARQAVYQYWLERRVAFTIALEKHAKDAHAVKPSDANTAAHGFLNAQVCEQLATRDPEVCKHSASSLRAAFQCRALMRTSSYRGAAHGGCDSVMPWFAPTCRLIFENDVDACATAASRAQSMCEMVHERLDPPGGVCAAPFDPHICAVELSLAGIRHGSEICPQAAANAGLDSANTKRLETLCRAATEGEASHCMGLDAPADPTAGQLTFTAHAELHGGMDGPRAIVGVAANSPVACAVAVGVADGERAVAKGLAGGVWPVGRAMVVETPLLDPASDPFRHEIEATATCVPTVAWEAAGSGS